MKTHELYKLALQGRLPVDRWSADIAAAAKFDMGVLDAVPKWLVKAGRELVGSNAARLPADRTIMEFETPGELGGKPAPICLRLRVTRYKERRIETCETRNGKHAPLGD